MADVTGFWTGEYSYDFANEPDVTFSAELTQLGAILAGDTTEQNNFDPDAGQILIAELFGKVSGYDVSFTKSYRNSRVATHNVKYEGQLSRDGNEISGTWKIPNMWSGIFRMTKAIEQKPKVAVHEQESIDV